MKKMVAILSALALIAACTACSDGNKDSSGKSSGVTSGAVSEIAVAQTAYKGDKLPLPDDFYFPQTLACAADGSLLLIYDDMYFTVRAVKYDAELNMGASFDIEKEEGEYLSYFELTDAGLRALSSRGAEDGGTLLTVHTYSDDGKITDTTELGDLGGRLSMNGARVQNVSFRGEECLITLDNAAVIADGSGNVADYCDIDNGSTYAFDRDGGIICCFYKNATRLDKLRKPSESELSENPNDASMLKPPVMGDDHFAAYLPLNDGVYGMTADGAKVQLLDFIASGLKPSEIIAIMPFGEDRFVACTESELLLLTARPDDYTDARETVIVGMHNHVNTVNLDMATDFADKVDGYQAEFREYEYGRDDLWRDILADDSPDVYIPYDHGELYRYVNLGALADFGELHDKYGGMSEDDFLPNIVSGMKYKGKLYSMTGYFTPQLNIAKRGVLSREQAEWNYDEFYDFVASQPADMYLAEHYVMDEPAYVFTWLCGENISDWVDYDKAECYFDSPEFVRLLEFCKNANCIGSYGDSYYANVTPEQMSLDAAENMNMLGNQKALFGTLNGADRFDSFVTVAASHSMTLDDITLVYPPNNRRGGVFRPQDEYCVLTSGKCQQGGWEFVNYALSYDVLSDPWKPWDFSTRKDAFDYILKTKFDTMNTGDTVNANVNGYMFSYDLSMTQEQFDYIKGVVLSCDRIGAWDDKLSPILTEEFGSYISGETSAEDCAKMIQNRVSIMLSEQA